jgi:hypothetical protein
MGEDEVSVVSDGDEFAVGLREAFDRDVERYLGLYVAAKGAAQRSRLGLHSMEHIGQIAEQARQWADEVFGRFAISADLEPDLPGKPRSIHDQYADTDAQIKKMTGPERHERAGSLLREYLAESQYVAAALDARRPAFDLDGKPVNDIAGIAAGVIDDLLSDQRTVRKVLEIWRGWPVRADPGSQQVWVQIIRGAAAEADQYFLWETAQRLICGCVRLLEHPEYRRYADRFGPGSRAGAILRGAVVPLTEMVWVAVEPHVADPDLRRVIEGEYASLPALGEMPPIAALRGSSYADTMSLIHLAGGIENLVAAYFLGEMDRLVGPDDLAGHWSPAAADATVGRPADFMLNAGPDAREDQEGQEDRRGS